MTLHPAFPSLTAQLCNDHNSHNKKEGGGGSALFTPGLLGTEKGRKRNCKAGHDGRNLEVFGRKWEKESTKQKEHLNHFLSAI